MLLKDRVKQIEKLENELQTPWIVSRSGIKLGLFGSQIYFTDTGDSDAVTLVEAQEIVAYLVEQLGGKVKWSKK